MCGINGIFAYKSNAPAINRDELLRVRERMIHRGPDSSGCWIDDKKRIGLAHRRLAIIDTTDSGAQPMACSNGRYVIIFNGEIYNYKELRKTLELEFDGINFQTNSDTEVLLQLYIHYKEKFLHKLRGMYAFAIWDVQDESLFIARDPFGIKPLYCYDDQKTIRFASQVCALVEETEIDKGIDKNGADSFWIWGHVTEPYSIYSSIKPLKPGTWLRYKNNSPVEISTFDAVEDMLKDKLTCKYNSLHDALLDSVKNHLVSDVSVGVFLSAGIDSATLVGLAAQLNKNIKTITIGFEEYKGTPNDEVPLAEKIAKLYETDHKTVWLSRTDLINSFEEFMQSMDQPTVDGFNTWLVSREAKKLGIKVAISGIGGDELFGSYSTFNRIPLIKKISAPLVRFQKIGKLIRQVTTPFFSRYGNSKMAGIFEYGGSYGGAYMLVRGIKMPFELNANNKIHAEFESNNFSDERTLISYYELTRYMRNQLLRDSDWAGMAHSIEIRVPLVDINLTRYISFMNSKGIIFNKRDMVNGLQPKLPEEVTNRTKTGFGTPIANSIDEILRLYSNKKISQKGVRGWQSLIFDSYINKK